MILLPLFSVFAARPIVADVTPALEQLTRSAHGRVGAAALVVETGERISWHGTERFPMQSVYKVPIAMATLRAVERKRLSLDERVRLTAADLVPAPVHSPIRDRYPRAGVDLSVRELLRYMIVESDGTASDVLLRLLGGTRPVMGYLRGLGVRNVVVATTEKEMARGEMVQYRNWATPEGVVAVLLALQSGKGISAANRALLLGWMTASIRGQKRIKGLLPPGTAVAHKTGGSNTAHGLTRATNDVGLVTLPDGRHLAVAIFVSDSTASDPERDAVIAGVARAFWERWVSTP